MIKDEGDFGVVKDDLKLPDAGGGRLNYVEWIAPNSSFPQTHVGAAFFPNEDRTFSLSNGYLDIEQHPLLQPDITQTGAKPPFRLELTTHPAMPQYAHRLSGPPEPSLASSILVTFDWLDATALARGSSQIYLVDRDAENKAVRQEEIDTKLLVSAEAHILSAFDQIARVVAHPSAFCKHSDDLEGPEVVVTSLRAKLGRSA